MTTTEGDHAGCTAFSIAHDCTCDTAPPCDACLACPTYQEGSW